MLKGKAELLVLDSKTGKIKQRVEDTNLVTNAVQNIFTGTLDIMARTMSNENTLDKKSHIIGNLFGLPNSVAKDMYGGIVLFSNTLTENKEHCIPTSEEIASILGYASRIEEPLAGSKMKGVFNSQESSFSEKTAKLVFDFDNDIANGTIKSVALTSAIGARYMPNSDVVPSTYAPSQLVSLKEKPVFSDTSSTDYSKFIDTNSLFKGDALYDAVYIADNKLCRYHNRDNVLKIYDISYLSQSGIGLSSNFTEGKSGSIPATEYTVTKSYDTIVRTSDMSAIYGFDSRGSSLETTILNKLSGGTPTEETINIPMAQLNKAVDEYLGIKSSSNILDRIAEDSIIVGTNIYFIVGDINNSDQTKRPTKARIFRLDFTGNVMYNEISKEAISLLFGTNTEGSNSYVSSLYTKFFSMCDSVCVGYTRWSYNDEAPMLRLDTQEVKITPSVYYVNTGNSLGDFGSRWYTPSWLKEPWVSCVNKDRSYHNFTLELYTCYLATINNLKEAVTKTNADKLRIVYTLTQN